MAKFADAADLERKRDALQAVVRAWVAARDADLTRRYSVSVSPPRWPGRPGMPSR